MGSLIGKLYQLDCISVSTEQAKIASEQQQQVNLWHQRFRHLSEQQLSEIIRNIGKWNKCSENITRVIL